MKARMPKQPGMGNMQQVMQQAQIMQDKMQEVQEQLNEREFPATAGGNAVSVVFNGKRELLSLQIDAKIIDPEDKEMLEDMVMAAVNTCLTDIERITDEEMVKINGDFHIPGML